MDMKAAEQVVGTLGVLRGVDRVEHLAKGFSSDRKYVLWQYGCPVFLLRMSGIEEESRRRGEFESLGWHFRRGTPCSEPIACGTDKEHGFCYSVLRYIPGDSAEEALPNLSPQQQYRVGFQAGVELGKMHELECPIAGFDWNRHKLAKHQRYAQKGRELGLSLGSHQTRAEKCVSRTAGLMEGRPARFQHDDYHPGNLLVQDDRLAGIIDFNRCDWGDPLHDFVNVSFFSRFISIPFACGQIDGYHQGSVPDLLWPLLNLYIAMLVPASLVWAYVNDPEKKDWWRSRLVDTLSSQDLEGGGPPDWYVAGQWNAH
jgi:aminoglycoside phosphotransferase (APT) family kinase protein